MPIVILLILLIFSLIFVLWQIWGFYFIGDKSIKDDDHHMLVEINGSEYRLEIANTPEARQIGLMNKKSLPKDGGMIFIFPVSGIYPFWMKDTLISLDIIWLNSNKEVVYLYENANPFNNSLEAMFNTIIPPAVAKYTVELNAGEIKKTKLKIGQVVKFDI